MKRYLVSEGTLTTIADAVRNKTGTTGKLTPASMAEKIATIRTYEGNPVLTGITIAPTGTEIVKVPPNGIDGFGIVTVEGDDNLVAENIKEGVTIYGVEGTFPEGLDTSDATATASDILEGATAYVNGELIVGTHVCEAEPILESLYVTPEREEITKYPGDGVDGFNEVIVAGVNLQDKEATPSATETTVEPDNAYVGLGRVTILGDSNLIAENIKEGISIFGISGTLKSLDLPLEEAVAITPSKDAQRIEPDSEHSGFSVILVAGDVDLIPNNIRRGVQIFDVTGSATCSELMYWDTKVSHDNGFIYDASDLILDLSYGGDS